jgi:heme-binding NEAT domain protein
MAKKTLNDAQQSFNNKNAAPKTTEPAKSSTNTNVKDFVQRVKVSLYNLYYDIIVHTHNTLFDPAHTVNER